MFLARRIAQKNCNLRSNLFASFSTSKQAQKGIDFEQIIRIDHTERIAELKKITISESCIKRLKDLQVTNKYLRIQVDSGGCSGFEYKFSLDDLKEEDKVLEEENCKVLIDPETEEFIKGSTIDYYEELIRSGFRVINNPNSETACSCGSSFAPKI
jgi:iron-sulfur cluster assembly accessory protein